jgi:hypothetical protein
VQCSAEPAALAAARRLGAKGARDAVRCSGGGNNRVWRIEAPAGAYALKEYPVPDPRDRLGHEFAGLAYATSVAPGCVPRPLAAAPEGGYALYEWIDGEPAHEPGPGDVRAALALLRALHEGRQSAPPGLPEACEAILDGAEAVAQVERRVARLRDAAATASGLRALLEERIVPALEASRDAARAAGPLPRAEQTLSPSDFGFHNALRRAEGTLVFLDFEYFGWDDPAKLVCDILWHPGMALSPALRRQFSAGLTDIYSDGNALRARLAAFEPLIALRWAAIVLGEFLPESWERRVFARGEHDRAAAKARQLEKARGILDRLQMEAQ